MDYENKMMSTAKGGVTVFILDDRAKRSRDEMNPYNMTGQYSAKAQEKEDLLKIMFGGK